MPLTAERKAETEQSWVAVHFSPQSLAHWNSFMARFKENPYGFDLESDSYLMSPEAFSTLGNEYELEDVTDIYNELRTRRSGYRVIRVGSSYEHLEGFEGLKNYAMVIKDYSTGDLVVYSEDGRFQGMIPSESAIVAFSPSRFVTVVEKPLQFFTNLEEARTSRL